MTVDMVMNRIKELTGLINRLYLDVEIQAKCKSAEEIENKIKAQITSEDILELRKLVGKEIDRLKNLEVVEDGQQKVN